MRSIGDPDYIYRPLSEKTKTRMKAAAQRRLGVPSGHRLVYGAIIRMPPAEFLMAHFLLPIFTKISAQLGSAAAAQASAGFRDDGIVALQPFLREIERRQRHKAMARLEKKIQAKIEGKAMKRLRQLEREIDKLK